MKLISVVVSMLLSVANVAAQNPDATISEFDEKEMEAAIARAKKEINFFIKELSKPTGESHAIKIPIEYKDGFEYFWLNDVKYRNGTFEGTINNDPESVKNVKLGDKRKVKKDDIVDWLFMRDGKMYGNYTVRPLMKSMPKNEADWLREILAEP